MPLHEFVCAGGHKNEALFLSLSAAESTEEIPCGKCKRTAKKIISAGAFIIAGVSLSAKRVVNPDSISFKGDSDYFK